MMIGIGTTDIDCSITLNVAGYNAHSVLGLRNRGTCFYVNIELKLRQCPVHNSSRTYTLLPVYYIF